MKLKTTLVVAFALVVATSASAETTSDTSTSSVKASDVGVNTNERKNIDEEITNAKLRAATGSKRTWSFASSFSYYGGALTNPTSSERPQLNEGQQSADPTKLTGQVSIKYRLTDHDNLNLGLGVDYTPEYTKNRATGEKEGAKANASTPYLSYSRVMKVGSIQHVISATASKYTAGPDINDSKLDYNLSADHTMMISVGDTKAEVGLVSFISQEFYSQSDVGVTLDRQIGIDPILEYAITDAVSFRTVSRWLTWNVMKGTSDSNGHLAAQTQSVGLGFAATRDIYLYPNMQWKWTTLAADQTTVGFSANINL